MRIERSEGCCGNLERGKSQEQAEDLGLDPTLASCCQRDIKEQQRVAYAKKALLSVDRIDKRSRESPNGSRTGTACSGRGFTKF